MRKVRVGIVGGAGYTGGELIRLLLEHPGVELTFVESRSHAGLAFAKVHADLWHCPGHFVAAGGDDVDVLFLCQGHGQSERYLAAKVLPSHTRVIDLSQDFRLAGAHGFMYGLPEVRRDEIAGAMRIANPGCFATAILLALVPLAKEAHLASSVHITGITGSTGAGQEPTATTHFSWRANNLSVYKPFSHQHLAEIRETLAVCQGKAPDEINWVPMRGGFTRGIFVSAYQDTTLSREEARELYADSYSSHPFVHVVPDSLDLKPVVNTNHCFVHVDVIDEKLHVTSVLDNLLKGASGQAVQNMNIAFGLPEDAGLRLKASAF